jgi:acyl-CoA synthetase (AMP-forming)/AMP-acid ligase II
MHDSRWSDIRKLVEKLWLFPRDSVLIFSFIRLQETRICAPVPLYHCFGMVMASLQVPVWGATCVFPAPSFDPDATLMAVQQEKFVQNAKSRSLFHGV